MEKFELIGGPFDGQQMRLPSDCRSFIGAHNDRYACYSRSSATYKLAYLNTREYIEDAMDLIEYCDDQP